MLMLNEDLHSAHLIAEAQSAEFQFEPMQPVGEGEKVIGEATPWIKKLWSLMTFYDQISDQARLDVKHAHQRGDKEAMSKASDTYSETAAKYQLLKRLMWYEIEATFRVWEQRESHTIGLREGWKVVYYADDDNPMMEMFRNLRGLAE